MENIKLFGTPISPSCKLDKDKNSKSINHKSYKYIIKSLLYLTASKSDIIFLYMQDFSLILRSHIFLLSKES